MPRDSPSHCQRYSEQDRSGLCLQGVSESEWSMDNSVMACMMRSMIEAQEAVPRVLEKPEGWAQERKSTVYRDVFLGH